MYHITATILQFVAKSSHWPHQCILFSSKHKYIEPQYAYWTLEYPAQGLPAWSSELNPATLEVCSELEETPSITCHNRNRVLLLY